MIPAATFKHLINSLDMGTATAEKDPLLPVAQIRTQEFYDLYINDRIDLVRGIKGAGKTAIYRVFYILKDNMEEKDDLFCIFGVENQGNPVFNNFKGYFSNFSSSEFEAFWILYFLSLIRSEISNNSKLKKIINNNDTFEKLEAYWKKLDVPFVQEKTSLTDLVQSVIDKIKLELKVSTSNNQCSFGPGLDIQLNHPKQEYRRPIYISDFRDFICELLGKHHFRIWIMLDRLDEVFNRLSPEEENGLKGLLKAAYNFSQPELRIKVFLRDDIISQLANAKEGFTALTHVTDRASATMKWSKENILFLIVKRLFSIESIQRFYQIETARIDSDESYRLCSFNTVFPKKIGRSTSLDWIINSLADSNGIVTPRDVINLLNMAKSFEFKKFNLNETDKEYLLSTESLKSALDQLSIDKKGNFLMAEFPHMREIILKLEGTYSNHTNQSLEKIYGSDWYKSISDLKGIGLIKHDTKKGRYIIPKIWRKGLGITQGKA